MNQGVELVWLSGNSTTEAKADGYIVAGLTPHLLAFLFKHCGLWTYMSYQQTYELSGHESFFIPLNPGFGG